MCQGREEMSVYELCELPLEKLLRRSPEHRLSRI